MNYQAGLGLRGVDFPHFLDAYAVALRVAPGVKLVALDQLATQLAARAFGKDGVAGMQLHRSEEHTSELQSLMRNSYAVFCLKKKKHMNAEKSPVPRTTPHNRAQLYNHTSE